MRKMRKLIVHGMSRSDWMVPGVEQYEHRAAVTAGNEDILVFSSPPDPAYLRYRERFLGFSTSNIFEARGRGDNLAQRILSDPVLMSSLRKSLQDGCCELDVFYVSPDEERLAQALGLCLHGRAELTERVGSKSGFRDLARKADVPIAEGMENLATVDAVCFAAQKFINRGKSIVIKDDQGVSGFGNFQIDHRQVNGDLVKVVQKALTLINFRHGVVEEWKSGVELSLGIQCYITDEECLLLSGFWEQILEGDHCNYVGSRYPTDIPDHIRQSMLFDISRLLETYQEAGWRGYVNFDIIICEDGSYFFVECNARKSAPYYPRRFVELCGLHDCHIMSTLFFSNRLKTMRFDELLMLSRDLLFSRERPRGIVFYNQGIMRVGEIQVIIVGHSQYEVDEFRRRLTVRLQDH